MKRIKGTNWTVNVTIIDLKDKGPDINFFLQKKKIGTTPFSKCINILK